MKQRWRLGGVGSFQRDSQYPAGETRREQRRQADTSEAYDSPDISAPPPSLRSRLKYPFANLKLHLLSNRLQAEYPKSEFFISLLNLFFPIFPISEFGTTIYLVA